MSGPLKIGRVAKKLVMLVSSGSRDLTTVENINVTDCTLPSLYICTGWVIKCAILLTYLVWRSTVARMVRLVEDTAIFSVKFALDLVHYYSD